VEKILWATERLIEEPGYEGLLSNPNLLLERADVPPGTFYAYFENTETAIEGVRILWMQRVYGFIDKIFQHPVATWPEVVDRIVDAFADFLIRDVWLTRSFSPTVRQAELKANEYICAQMRREVEKLGYRFIGDDLDEMMLVEMLDRLTRFARVEAQSYEGDSSALDKIKLAGRDYLGRLLSESEPAFG
jgi:AcrR family transcriptional regulator